MKRRSFMFIFYLLILGGCTKNEKISISNFKTEVLSAKAPKAEILKLPSSIRKGLVAWYPFNGNANDLSGNNNHGFVSGASLTTDRFGVADGAFYFNGSSGIRVTSTPSLESFSNRYSFSTWVYIEQFTGPYPAQFPILGKNIICANSAGSDPFLFIGTEVSQGYNIQSIECGVMTMGGVSNAASTTGTWTHVAATYDGSSIKIYTNGILMSSTPATASIINNSGYLTIGYYSFGFGKYGYGKIDNLLIHNRALTQNEVTYLASN